ncbi:MAG TPA: hypothetical protein VN609_01265 [Propionibacteriaceae bacterium]|nr:hypothetical protein [Propionibacteriaceae bacterium]
MLIPLHGIASRRDLPLPFSFVMAGAVLALVISFAILIFAWRTPHLKRVGGRDLPRVTAVVDSSVVQLIARALILATYAWAGLAMMAGQDLLTNPIFGFVFVWMWVGLVPISLLLGQFWRATNPLRTIHRGLSAIARVDPEQGLLSLPAGIGVWPAAIGLFGFGWLELVQPDRTTLAVLRVWALAWLVILVLGAIVFGQRWIGAADPFEVYASTIAQMSIFRRVGDQLRLVNPLAGLNAWRAPPGSTAVVAALLGSTAFDSFTNTSWWIQTVQNSALPTVLWGTAGLLTMIIIVFVTFSLGAAWMGRYGDRPAWEYPRLMVGSLLPIVLGYVVAHYATLLIVEGQRVAINFSDPLGRGWNTFGSAEMGVNSAIFNHPTGIAVMQACAIVGGHVFGIICAHEKAVALLPPDRAVRGQMPLLLVMIGYTCAGLLLLFSP